MAQSKKTVKFKKTDDKDNKSKNYNSNKSSNQENDTTKN
jgi:hypothetical protein